MSETDYNAINPYLYHMYSNDPKDLYLWTNATREETHYNALLKDQRPKSYKAIVLSGYRTETNTGTGTDASDAAFVRSSDGKRYLELTVWPIDADFGMQCPDPLLSGNKNKIKAIIAICTEVCRIRSKFPVDGNQSPLSFGQLIDVEIEDGAPPLSYGGRRFSFPEGLPQRIPEFDQLYGLTATQSTASLFSQPTLLMSEFIPIANSPTSIAEAAKRYDNDSTIPNKPNHATRFASEMHPEFVAYAKAVIYDMWNQLQATVTLNSTFRTVGKQRQMRAKWDAWVGTGDKHNPNGTGPNPHYVARPAKAGHSKHNLGTAIDFNVSIGTKVYGSKKKTGATKQDWLASGLVDVIESHGLKWGGYFPGNYDPIHMHLLVSEAVRKKIIGASGDITNKIAAVAAISKVSLK